MQFEHGRKLVGSHCQVLAILITRIACESADRGDKPTCSNAHTHSHSGFLVCYLIRSNKIKLSNGITNIV